MAICTQCGTLINDEDLKTHKCKPENIPAKGKEVLKGSNQQTDLYTGL